jgi:hypothetical protein
MIKFNDLLVEVADRRRLAKWPSPEYTCHQASSYDRESEAPNPKDGEFRPESGRDWGKGWFANRDFNQFIRSESISGRTEHVMMEDTGPGCIARCWNALGGKAWDACGTVRIYLDGAAEPTIEMSVKDLVGGKGLVPPPFSYLASPGAVEMWRGRNLYLPIPYAKGCKVTWDGEFDEGTDTLFYYHVNYRRYTPGTAVRTFSLDQLVSADALLKDTAKRLRRPRLESPVTGRMSAKQITLRASEDLVLARETQACIQSLSMKLSAKDLQRAYRSAILKISFDGNQTVCCPVGEFFGVGYDARPHKTLFAECDNEGLLTVRWTMPFKTDVRIEIKNAGEAPVTVECLRANLGAWEWDERSMHFHAAWFELNSIDTTIKRDVNYNTITGRGVYVGDTLTIFNSHPDWWGEGDEKIWVDGESFPSHFGTGTEDYYGYAWCRPQVFSFPFHSQPNGSGNKTVGTSTNNRYRTLDAIPFKQSIQVDMELWHPFYAPMNYAPATFWYARPGSQSKVEPNSAHIIKCALNVGSESSFYRKLNKKR